MTASSFDLFDRLRAGWAGVLVLMLVGVLVADAAGPGRGRWAAPVKVPGRAEVGDEVADFELEDVDGNAVKLSDAKGKQIVVIEFGACT